MINVLVTGASGQLAKCIKDVELLYPNLNFIYTDYLELNICNSNQVNIFFTENNPINYCINCAAYTDVDKAEIEEQKAFDANTNGVKNLAEACKINNSILIHISTDFVFDGNNTRAYSEEDLTNPISIYGKSKLMAEQEIKQILDNHYILRTSWLYSEHGNNFMKTMLRLSQERDELNVVSNQIGTPTYAKDLSRVILNIINNNNKNYGTYNYSNEGITSWYEFAKTIFKFSDIKIKLYPIKSEDYPTLAKRPKYSVLDKSKIKKTLNIKIPFWKDSLKKAILNIR